jgi:hypothetical protein
MNDAQQENGQVPPQKQDPSLATIDGNTPNNDQGPTPVIPGKERLDEAVGKAIGGTVIPSDIHPGDMPATTQLDADKKNAPVETQPQSRVHPETTEVSKTGEDNEDEDQKDDPEAEDTDELTQKRKDLTDLKKRTVGAYPEVTRIGWLEAYKVRVSIFCCCFFSCRSKDKGLTTPCHHSNHE